MYFKNMMQHILDFKNDCKHSNSNILIQTYFQKIF